MDKKTIALIAHDNKKPQIVKWATENSRTLSIFDLCGTGTTAGLIEQSTGLKVKNTYQVRWAAIWKSVRA